MDTFTNIQDCVLDVMEEHGIQGVITDTVIEIDDAIDYCINYYIYITLHTMYGIESLTPVEKDINRLIQSQGILYKGNTPLIVIGRLMIH